VSVVTAAAAAAAAATAGDGDGSDAYDAAVMVYFSLQVAISFLMALIAMR